MEEKRKRVATAMFMVYCALMLWLLFDRRGPVEGVPYWEQVAVSYNLRPFHTIQRYTRLLHSSRPVLVKLAVVNLLGNVVMFVPLGFFLPRLYEKTRRMWRTLLAAAGIVILVEVFQMLTLVGVCDIDDLILNEMGVAVGYGLHCLIGKCETRTA